MLPSSHVVPINVANPCLPPGTGILADAFSEFISASVLLESSYRSLQKEVAHLGVELAERNDALTRSLGENRRMREALEQIIDSMPCGVMVLDTAEAIVTINPEGRRLLDLHEARVRSLRDVAAVSGIHLEFLAAGAGQGQDSEICVTAAEGRRWLAIGNRKLPCAPVDKGGEDQGAPLESIWILRDITASKQAEEARESARNLMALAEISSILAHEIRNPLASMELFAGLIAEDPEQTALWVSNLQAGIRQLSATVNNVLCMRTGGEMHTSPVNLAACMRGSAEFVRPIADQAGVALLFSAPDSDVAVAGDENILRQIVLNLLCNAIRHTPAGGTISVRVWREFEKAYVAVSDTGCGIPEELTGCIFEPGFSANGDTPGLGLAVCKRLIVQHGGSIHVFSRVNHGSTFEMELPAL